MGLESGFGPGLRSVPVALIAPVHTTSAILGALGFSANLLALPCAEACESLSSIPDIAGAVRARARGWSSQQAQITRIKRSTTQQNHNKTHHGCPGLQGLKFAWLSKQYPRRAGLPVALPSLCLSSSGVRASSRDWPAAPVAPPPEQGGRSSGTPLPSKSLARAVAGASSPTGMPSTMKAVTFGDDPCAGC